MKPELAHRLYERFPAVFPSRERSPQSSPFEAFGFQIGDGWFPIVERMAEKLSQIEGVRVGQVKEKFGDLRVYLEWDDGLDRDTCDRAHAIVSEAESASHTVCEDCGQPGKTRPRGWIRVLCDACDAIR